MLGAIGGEAARHQHALTRRSLAARLALAGPAIAAASVGSVGCRQPGQAPASVGSTRPAQLELWHVIGPGPVFEAFQGLLDEYSAGHPGITFELARLEGSSAQSAGYQGKITAAIVAGTPPDVVHMNRPPEFGEAGLLTRLDDYVKRDAAFNPGDIFEAPWARCTFFGRVWGVPVICDSRALWYNKALFREAGLDPARPPVRWDAQEEMAVRLTRRSAAEIEQLGFSPMYGNADLYSYIYLNGGEIIQYSGTNKVEIMFTRPQAIEAAEWVVRVYDRVGGYEAVSAFFKNFTGGAQSPFFVGKLGMLRNGSWLLGDMRRYQVQMEYGLAPEPYGPSARGPATLVGGYNWSIASGAPHADLGWAFLSWLSQPKQAARYAEAEGNMPARKSALNTEYIQRNPDIRFFFEALRYGKPFPTAPWTQTMWDAVNVTAQNAIIQRRVPAKQALEEAARVVQVEIDAYFAQKQGA